MPLPLATDGLPLEHYLADQSAVDDRLKSVLLSVAAACGSISALVARGALADVLGATETQNVQGETQKTLDVVSNDILVGVAERTAAVAAIASEELEEILVFADSTDGRYLLLFDPLDGSSNIDVNVSVGTIFSILPAPAPNAEITARAFLQPGRRQLAAGYALYGPQTNLVFTLGAGVVVFTLDPGDGTWRRTRGGVRVPEATDEFAINMSNHRHWSWPIRAYIDNCLSGEDGPRGKNFNMRWVGSMVADAHRVLSRGGIFLYPWDSRDPDRPGKLRLMYEANPMAFLVEQAGGGASDGMGAILDIQPQSLHQRTSVVLGSLEEVTEVVAGHAQSQTAIKGVRPIEALGATQTE